MISSWDSLSSDISESLLGFIVQEESLHLVTAVNIDWRVDLLKHKDQNIY